MVCCHPLFFTQFQSSVWVWLKSDILKPCAWHKHHSTYVCYLTMHSFPRLCEPTLFIWPYRNIKLVRILYVMFASHNPNDVPFMVCWRETAASTQIINRKSIWLKTTSTGAWKKGQRRLMYISKVDMCFWSVLLLLFRAHTLCPQPYLMLQEVVV